MKAFHLDMPDHPNAECRRNFQIFPRPADHTVQMDPRSFDTGAGHFGTDETRVFARLAEAGHPVPPCLLTYGVDASLPGKPGRAFTERVSKTFVGLCLLLYESDLSRIGYGVERWDSYVTQTLRESHETIAQSLRWWHCCGQQRRDGRPRRAQAAVLCKAQLTIRYLRAGVG